MNSFLLKDVAEIFISNVDKKIIDNEIQVQLCNFTDVYYNWAITKNIEKKLMRGTAKQIEIDKYSLKKGYVAITKDSETKYDIGQSTYIADDINNMLLGYHCALIKPNPEKLSGKYLNALLHTKYATKYFEKNASGSGQRYTLSIDTINNFPLNLADIQTQNTIASILTNIDKKIEINNCINNKSQEMAKTIYSFNFASKKPNEKLIKIVVERDKSKIQVSHSQNVYGEYPFFTSGDAINEWADYLVDGINCYLSTGGNASVKIYKGKAAYSTDTWCISGGKKYSAYLYFFLDGIKKYIDLSFFAGSGLKHLQKDSLLQTDIYLPSEDEIKQFNKIIVPLLDIISEKYRENIKLIKLRDFILPMLMNGQATVCDNIVAMSKKESVTVCENIIKDENLYNQRFDMWLSNCGLAARGDVDKKTLREIFDAMDEDDK